MTLSFVNRLFGLIIFSTFMTVMVAQALASPPVSPLSKLPELSAEDYKDMYKKFIFIKFQSLLTSNSEADLNLQNDFMDFVTAFDIGEATEIITIPKKSSEVYYCTDNSRQSQCENPHAICEVSAYTQNLNLIKVTMLNKSYESTTYFYREFKLSF